MKIFTKELIGIFSFLLLGGMCFGQDVLWGGPGDANGEFADGLNDWTVNDLIGAGAVWEWSENGQADGGAFYNEGPINSPSVANGAAVFDSDYWDNGGDGNNIGGGPAPAPHECELISPVIDLTNEPQVSIEFNQYFRNFDAQTLLVWSNDGGATWEDTINVNPRIRTNAPPTSAASKKVFHLIGAGGTDAFQFKFVFSGEYYFWTIDDVAVIRRPDFDLGLGDFFYPASSYEQPRSQIEDDTMGFFLDVRNWGKVAQTDITLTVQVLDGNTELFSDEIIIPELAPETIDTVFEFDDSWPPEGLSNGTYDIVYSITSAEDDYTPGDNDTGAPFRVSSARYTKEDGDEDWEVAFQPGGGGEYYVGNLFRTSSNWVDQYQMTVATFGMAFNQSTPAEGKSVNVYLLRVREDVDPGFDNFDDMTTNVENHPQLELRGFGEHTFTNEQSFSYSTVALEDLDFDADGVVLHPGERYFLMVKYDDDSQDLFQMFNEKLSYFFQISTVSVSDQWFLGGFGEDEAAVCRMVIDLYTTTDETPLPDDALTFFPNPATDLLNVDLSFEAPTLANVTIADLNGRVIQIDELVNVAEAKRQYDVSELPAGTYLVRVATEEGTSTKKFVVVR